jgi:hypothetical protein
MTDEPNEPAPAEPDLPFPSPAPKKRRAIHISATGGVVDPAPEPGTAPPPAATPPPRKLTDEDKKDLDTLQQLQELADSPTPEQRERFLGLGMNVPQGDMTNALLGRFKFGVRCTFCNQIALYFVGDEWVMEDGTVLDLPPPMPHTAIAWTQNLPPNKINRHAPQCQHCANPVPLDGGGTFRRDRGRIVEVGLFEQSRDKAYERKRLRDFKKEVDSGGGGIIDLPTSYDEARRPVSTVIAAQRGEGALKEIEFLAEATGVKELLQGKGEQE